MSEFSEKKIPAYLLLYQQIRSDIINQNYPYETKLPSKRALAEKTGVSVITVEHAYALLAEEGYIEPRQRSGYFVIFKNEDGFAGFDFFAGRVFGQSPAKTDSKSAERMFTLSAEKTDSQGPKTFLSAETPKETQNYLYFPFSILAKTMRGVLNDYGEALFERSPNEGTLFLRSEISRYLARSRSIQVSPERIIIGAGSEYLYHLMIGLLGKNRIYGIEDPSYKMIESVYKMDGVSYKTLPLGPEGISSEALRNSSVNVLHITPYRSFPSGVSASASKRHEYLRWAEVPGRYLVEDDYESEFSVLRKPEDTLFSLTGTDNVLYLNTFTRSISPSLRVGYMLLPDHLLPVFREKLGFISCTVPTAVQYVLGQLLRNGDFERHINRVRRIKRKELPRRKR